MSNAQAAEDMVQETFLKLWMQRDKMGNVDNPEAYSITVLRRIFYDKMRAGHLQEVDKDVGSLQVSSSQNISKQLEEADEYQRVRLLINHLPEPRARKKIREQIKAMRYDKD